MLKLQSAFEAFTNGSPPEIQVRIAQLALMFLGHSPRGIDGLFGNNTRMALQAFERAEEMQETTQLTNEAFDRLVQKAFGGNLDD